VLQDQVKVYGQGRLPRRSGAWSGDDGVLQTRFANSSSSLHSKQDHGQPGVLCYSTPLSHWRSFLQL
jgi:hypothetical protein